MSTWDFTQIHSSKEGSAGMQEEKDVGCGTGRWVIEMARTFPGAQVVGLDIEPPQSGQILPPNARFVQANLLDGLPFADRSFDFTHQRLMVLAIPAAHWSAVVGELVRVTHPGGWVELLEGLSRLCWRMQEILEWENARKKSGKKA
jgi:ubiquinone/menaquinone biosynthesis C-methylase UbiE